MSAENFAVLANQAEIRKGVGEAHERTSPFVPIGNRRGAGG